MRRGESLLRGVRGWRRRLFWTVALPGLGVALVAATNLRWTVTGSIPSGVYQVVWRAYQPGDVVLVCLPEPVSQWARTRGYLPEGTCPPGVGTIGKPVAAGAGGRVEISASGVSVNGRWLHGSKRVERDSFGRPVPVASEGVLILGEGEIWLHSGHHPRSLDSRIFGPARAEWVRQVLSPLWVEAG